MWTSVRTFKIGLYEEHLGEASFLYEQRRGLLSDPEMSWLRIRDFEERLTAHIDALSVGEQLALDVCREHILSADPGELFAITSLACVERHAPVITELTGKLDYENAAAVRAVTDALNYVLPPEWQDFTGRALLNGAAGLRGILSEVVGYRRLPYGPALLTALRNIKQPPLAVVWSLGRLREATAEQVLSTTAATATDTAIQAAALVALARIGKSSILTEPTRIAGQPHSHLFLGLACGRDAARCLLALLQSGQAGPDCVTALGLLGDLSTVRALVSCLKVEPLAATAACALEFITAAGLFEDAFIPEEPNPDEWSEDESAAYRQTGEVPKRPDGKPYGTTVRRVSRDAAVWTAWLNANASSFKAHLRYRRGKPYSDAGLVEYLCDESSDKFLRALTQEELVIRYGADVPFERDMPVRQQFAAIRSLSAWVEAHAGRFEPGRWYFAGRVID